MKIVISGYYGSKNGGDEAMLAAMLEALRDEIPDLRITVISLNPEYTRRRHNVESIHWLDFFCILKEIRSANLLISGGGSLLQNVTSSRSILYYLTIIFFALSFGKKVMLYAQGIGPIRGFLAHKLTNIIINRVDLITVRDQGSVVELERLNIKRPKIFCTADPVLALKPVSITFGEKILYNHNLSRSKKLIGVAIRNWMGWENFSRELAIALDRLAEIDDVKIIFISMKFPDDIQSAKFVANLMQKKSIVLEEELTTQEILSLVGCVDVLIGVRLHALIFAGVMNIPMIGISYDPKIDRFLESIGEESIGKFFDINADKIFNATLKKISSKEYLHDDKMLKQLGDRARQNAKFAHNLIS